MPRIAGLVVVVLVFGCGGVTEAGDDSAGFTLSVDPPAITLAPGDSVEVTVTATRDPGFTGAVDLSVATLPNGVDADITSLGANDSSVVLTFATPDDSADHGAFVLEIAGVSGELQQTASLNALIRGAPGDLDRSFGGGVVTFAPFGVGTVGRDVQVSGDQVLVTGATIDGRAVVARLLDDGALDPSFGVDGAAAISGGDTGGGIILRLDGDRILAAGWGGDLAGTDNTSFNIYAFTSDGDIDQSFGLSGVMTLDPTQMSAGFAELSGFEIGSDGRLFAVGVDFGTNDSHFVHAGSAGNSARVVLSSAVNVLMRGMTTIGDSDDSLAVGAITPAVGGPSDFIAIRVDAAGNLADEITIDFSGGADLAAGVAELGDGTIAVAGVAGGALAFAKLDANLDLVPGFGVGGKVETGVAFNAPAPNFMTVDAAGNLVVTGGSGAELVVARFTPDGALDDVFGGGMVAVDPAGLVFGQQSGFYGITTDGLGRIVVVGEAGGPGEQQIVVARLWN